MSDTVSPAVQAIEAEIVVQEARQALIRRYLAQPTMVPGSRVYAAHSARLESLGFEVHGLKRALAVVKRREAVDNFEMTPELRAALMTANAAHRSGLL